MHKKGSETTTSRRELAHIRIQNTEQHQFNRLFLIPTMQDIGLVSKKAKMNIQHRQRQ